MIEILEKRGEAGSATLFLVMAGIQFLIGISLLLFSNYSKKYVIQKANISMLSKALVYLKFYLLVSIILACLSAIPTIFTIFFLIASNL
jgi:hypothetical protein